MATRELICSLWFWITDHGKADNRALYAALEPVAGSYCPGPARMPYHMHRYGARAS